MDLLLIALLILGFVCMVSLSQDGEAHEWMGDYNNQRKLRKCFGQEGIMVFIHDHDRSVSISFSHKGSSYSKVMTWTKAYHLYQENPKGYGIRQKLVKMFK
jgi:hypothetical protein